MEYKKVVTSAFVLSTLAFALPVFAVEGGVNVDVKAGIEARRASSTEHRAEVKANIELRRASTTNRLAEIKMRIEERKASSTERRLTMQTEVAKRKVENVKKLLLATIERLEKIGARIESRIEKINDRGGDTAEAEGYVSVAQEDLADAKIAVDAFANLDLSGATAGENFETIRAAAAEAREFIRSARENLMKAVRSLKSVNATIESNTTVEAQ